jgi:hypothetical protein
METTKFIFEKHNLYCTTNTIEFTKTIHYPISIYNQMKIIFFLIATLTAAKKVVEQKTATYSCPSGYHVSQINANLGGILDRVNFRCNNSPNFASFGLATKIPFNLVSFHLIK